MTPSGISASQISRMIWVTDGLLLRHAVRDSKPERMKWALAAAHCRTFRRPARRRQARPCPRQARRHQARH